MYVVIWKFVVKAGCEAEFEEAYGRHGVWAEFFRRGKGYQGTELLRDESSPECYITVDRWQSRASYEKFQASYAAEYKAIDQRCETLTESETRVGAFSSVDESASS